MMEPQKPPNTPGSTMLINLADSVNDVGGGMTQTAGDIVIAKIPLKIRDSASTFYDLCTLTIASDLYFLYEDPNTQELFAYYFHKFAGGETSISISNLACKYYPLQNYDNSMFLFELEKLGTDQVSLHKWKMRVSDANIQNTLIKKWNGAATGGIVGKADYDLFNGLPII